MKNFKKSKHCKKNEKKLKKVLTIELNSDKVISTATENRLTKG